MSLWWFEWLPASLIENLQGDNKKQILQSKGQRKKIKGEK